MVIGFIFTAFGIVILSLVSKRHRSEALPHFTNLSVVQARCLRWLGFISVGTSLLLLYPDSGWGLGMVYVVAWVALVALVQSLVLSYRPRWVLWVLLLLVILICAVPVASYWHWA